MIPVFVGSGHFRHFLLDRTPLHPGMANETRQRDVTLFFAGGSMGPWAGAGGGPGVGFGGACGMGAGRTRM